MVSKSRGRASAVLLAVGLAVLLCRCSSVTRRVPWRDEPIGDEINVAFTLENNLPMLQSVTIDGHPARPIFASANARTALDETYAGRIGVMLPHAVRLHFGQKSSARVTPVAVDLRGLGDALVGADVAQGSRVAIDYTRGLLTFQQKPIETEGMLVSSFAGEPAVEATVDGRQVRVVIDTASPDTLVLPLAIGPTGSRRALARVTFGGIDFGDVDVRYANVAEPRAGNRLLSKFFIMIDYREGKVSMWRDPRMK
jgi:hypothetical protein